jgi:hypothetical protein
VRRTRSKAGICETRTRCTTLALAAPLLALGLALPAAAELSLGGYVGDLHTLSGDVDFNVPGTAALTFRDVSSSSPDVNHYDHCGLLSQADLP